MKKLIILIVIFSINSYSQIATNAIKQFNTIDDLKSMDKTKLKVLYTERIKVLHYKIQYLALSNEDNFSYADAGIPETKENIKILANQKQATDSFIYSSIIFQKEMISYADKEDIIKAILLYEQILKDIKVINE